MKINNDKASLMKGIFIGALTMMIISFGFYSNQILGAKESNNLTVNEETTEENGMEKTELLQNKNDQISQLNNLFRKAAQKTVPSVVTVYASKIVENNRNVDPFEFFFRRNPRQYEDQDNRSEQRMSGSGVIISNDGYIITNNHVIGEVDEIKVKLSDKREFDAKVIGTDPLTDIALIKIENAEDLVPINWGNSYDLQIGDQVLAVGNPLNIGVTVTNGIVSALNRNLRIIESNYGIEKFIQTDAAINPGNSGGALVNLNGELVGINTAIASGTGYFAGYGFAVPVNMVKNVMEQLKKYGKVKRGYIGISLKEVDYKIAKANGLKSPRGVYVESVMDGMPGKIAGIQVDDIILEVDGVEVNEPNDLQAEISSKNHDSKVKLKILRDKKEKIYTLQLKERDGDEQNLASNNTNSSHISKLGLALSKLDENTVREMKNKFDIQLKNGLQVVKVDRFSEASRSGLKEGDIILEVGNKKLYEVEDFTNYISKLNSGDAIKLFVQPRNDKDKRVIYMEIK